MLKSKFQCPFCKGKKFRNEKMFLKHFHKVHENIIEELRKTLKELELDEIKKLISDSDKEILKEELDRIF